MAEIVNTSGEKKKRGISRRTKRRSTRTDLTPMVDLGFLLIAFFMLTTQWSKPAVLKVFLPAPGDSTLVSERVTLTLIPIKDRKLFYYEGGWKEALLNHHFGVGFLTGASGVEDIIRNKQLSLARDPRSKDGRKELVVIIKPAAECSLGNLVSTLDEMTIQDVSKYAIADLDPAEKIFLRQNNY